MKVAVIADTHTSATQRPVPAGAWPYLESSDHILHAGDVTDPRLLDELASLAPVTVVMGNCDGPDVRDWGATDDVVLELDDVPVAMIHDSGLNPGRRERMRKRFPGARVVVFGHSHQPVSEDDDVLLLFNPGSATWKRKAPFTSMGLLWIDGDRVEGEVVPV
jgi:putative phosphoesterase